jgi:hypothetical protein
MNVKRAGESLRIARDPALVIVGNWVETREDGLILGVRFSMELKSVAEEAHAPKFVGKGLWCINGRFWRTLQRNNTGSR